MRKYLYLLLFSVTLVGTYAGTTFAYRSIAIRKATPKPKPEPVIGWRCPGM